MAVLTPTRPRWLVIARSAAGVYARKVLATVAALYALFGGVQLAGRTGSPLLVALALTVLGVAGAELLVPGLVTRDTLPARTVQVAAAVPIAVAWVALAVVIGSAGGDAITAALVSLRALAMMAAAMMLLLVGRGLIARDPEIVPAFRADR